MIDLSKLGQGKSAFDYVKATPEEILKATDPKYRDIYAYLLKTDHVSPQTFFTTLAKMAIKSGLITEKEINAIERGLKQAGHTDEQKCYNLRRIVCARISVVKTREYWDRKNEEANRDSKDNRLLDQVINAKGKS